MIDNVKNLKALKTSLISVCNKELRKMRIVWSNCSDLTRPGPPKSSSGKEIRLFEAHLGW